jgi:Ran GTPase-activating protein (RanGAP) involved in mRNA processing and transport
MSHKFENEFAEALYERSLNGFHDDSLGDCVDFGWYGLFLKDHAILSENNHGFVTVSRFDSAEATEDAWDELTGEYEEFEDEAEESFYEGYGQYDDDTYDNDSDLMNEY